MIDRRYTEIMRPADGPMNLDAGKPNAKDAFIAGSFTLASLLVAAIGCWLAIWSVPTGFEDSKLWYVLVGFGSITCAFSLHFSWSMKSATVVEWEAYQIRKNQWHEVQLAAYKAFKGIEVVKTYSETELSPKFASHVLLAGLAVHYANLQTTGRNAAHSVRSLEKLYIGNNADRTIFLGELKGTSPESMAKVFNELGWITNRKPGASGQWVPTSIDELVSLLVRNWDKVNGKQYYD